MDVLLVNNSNLGTERATGSASQSPFKRRYRHGLRGLNRVVLTRLWNTVCPKTRWRISVKLARWTPWGDARLAARQHQADGRSPLRSEPHLKSQPRGHRSLSNAALGRDPRSRGAHGCRGRSLSAPSARGVAGLGPSIKRYIPHRHSHTRAHTRPHQPKICWALSPKTPLVYRQTPRLKRNQMSWPHHLPSECGPGSPRALPNGLLTASLRHKSWKRHFFFKRKNRRYLIMQKGSDMTYINISSKDHLD